MTETKNAATGSGLYAALAEFQKELPKIGKGQTGKVEGEKDGRRYSYEYKYADLADITERANPLLGKHGLAFTARPTLNATGQFVLAYKLTHVSGEAEAGEYPLPSPERVKPQQIGSAISYAKRYSFCAVTGIVPAGEDDDGHAAQQASQDAWENARPAPPKRQQQREPEPDPAQWETSAPAQAASNGPAAQPDGEPDEGAQEIAVLAHEARTVSEISALNAKAHAVGKLARTIANPATGGKGELGKYLTWRRSQLQAEHKALAELTAAGKRAGFEGDVLDARVAELVGVGIEGATVAQLKEATAKLADPAKAGAT